MNVGLIFGRGLLSFWICVGIEGKQDTLLSVELRSVSSHVPFISA